MWFQFGSVVSPVVFENYLIVICLNLRVKVKTVNKAVDKQNVCGM